LSANKQATKSRFKDVTEGLFFALIAALVLRQFVVQAYTIPTSSMEKSLMVGDFLLVNKFNYGMITPDWVGIPYTTFGFAMPYYRFPALNDIKPYDVVIFRYPKNKLLDYIKRCIAIEGQTVEIKNKNLFVDNKPFPRPPQMQHIDKYVVPRVSSYNRDIFRKLGSRDNYGPIVIPPKSYWVMGDNRDNSQDSRYWGFVPHDLMVGQGLIIYFSLDQHVPWYNLFTKIRFDRIGTVIR